MSRVIGKAFKIKKSDVKSYGYAKPNSRRSSGGRMARNGGVTAIAAINGRGAYLRSKSARSAMTGLSGKARMARARAITGAPMHRMNATRAQIAAARRNIRQAIASRGTHKANAKRKTPRRSRKVTHRANRWKGESARHSKAAVRGWYSPSPYKSTAGTAAARRRRHKANKKSGSKKKATKARKMKTNARRHRRNRSPKQRAAAIRNLRKARRARATPNRKSSRRPRRKLRANSAKRTTKRRSHRRNFSAKQRAAAIRNLRKARHAKNGTKTRSRRKKHRANKRTAKRRTRRTHRANGMMSNRKRRTHRKNRRTTKKRAHRSNRRRATRRTHRRNFSRKQRAAAIRNLRKARMAKNGRRKTRRTRKNGKRRTKRRTLRANTKRRTTRRSHRKNRRHVRRHRRNGMMSNVRRTKRRTHRKNRRTTKRRTHRRNGRKAFRRNEFMATLKAVAQIGVLTTVGFMAHKVVTKVFADQVLDRLFGSSGVVTPPAPAAVSGLEQLQPYRSLIAGTGAAGLGIYLANRFVKDARTKMFLTAGMATSLLHSVAVTLLAKFVPSTTGYLAGHDGTAASISAMYGLGAGADIQPHYHPIGMGEYFAQNGVGEYFAQNGFGEYGANPDLMQAAAGYGIVENMNSDHVNPGDDLDRQLSIAEAAAGVGAMPMQAAAGFGRVQPFEASAGIGEYFAQDGLGAINTVPPTADTWIPGGGPSGQLWAGTRSISQGQSANELMSAGILETNGNQGVFG